MLKLVLGTLFGAALAVGYVKYEVELPTWLQLMRCGSTAKRAAHR